MNKKLIIAIGIFLLLFLSCRAQKTVVRKDSIYVYKDGKRISPLIKNVYKGDCSTCYVHQTLTIFENEITFKIPFYQHANRFDLLYTISKNKENDSILRIDSQETSIHYYTLYFSKKKNKLLLKNSVEILKEDVRIKLGEKDFEHVPSIRICKMKFNKILSDSISITVITDLILNKKQCRDCIINDNNFRNCIKH